SARYDDLPWVKDFVDGDQACRSADLVVCNGGSPGVFQALAHGVPVLGIPRNMDQFLNMRAIEHSRAGVLALSTTTPEALRGIVANMLGNMTWRDAARRIAVEIEAFDTDACLTEALSQVCATFRKN
ncbi:MAG: glycosyltransferase, partial [Hyphomonadaceae bacterium]|nr:glycosyltransferase [Hyphomonadaceae bacterium]